MRRQSSNVVKLGRQMTSTRCITSSITDFLVSADLPGFAATPAAPIVRQNVRFIYVLRCGSRDAADNWASPA